MKKLLYSLLFITAFGLQADLVAASKKVLDNIVKDDEESASLDSVDESTERKLEKAEKGEAFDKSPATVRLLKEGEKPACVCNEGNNRIIDCKKYCKKFKAPWTGAVMPMKNGFACLCASASSNPLAGRDNWYINCKDPATKQRCQGVNKGWANMIAIYKNPGKKDQEIVETFEAK